jgi:hypothetical protein
MGAGGNVREHDEDTHCSAVDDQPRRIRVIPEAQLVQIPPEVERAHFEERRRPIDRRPIYWRGIDWRDYDSAAREFQGPRCAPQEERRQARVSPPVEERRRTMRYRELASQDQRQTRSCAGFAVAAALRANVAIHRAEDPGALNPYFIWGLARERDVQLADRRGGLLNEALWVVSTYGTPNAGDGPTAEDVACTGLTRRIPDFALEFQGSDGPRRASQRKIQGFVTHATWLGDAAAHLHAFGPVVAKLMVERRAFNHLGREATITYRGGQVHDGQLTNLYAGHAVVIVGYLPYDHPTHPDSFVIVNSYGPEWGDGGFAYLPVETARQCVVASYGLVLREMLGYAWGGQERRRTRSHLFAERPVSYVATGGQ